VNFLLGKVGVFEAKYLEIGCASNALFDSVPCNSKVGVDPEIGGTHRMTSDEFFTTNHEEFDLIFIDGLHHYEQIRKDAVNALSCIRDGGWIAFHDFLPRNWKEHHVPRLQVAWCGDCWKLAYELSQSEGIDFRILLIDHGVGVIRAPSTAVTIVDKSDELLDAEFDYFANIVSDLPIVSWEDGLRWIDS
jgi:hypothetical protein